MEKHIYNILILIILLLFASCRKELDVIPDSHSLPVIKLTMEDQYLWSLDSGLYVIGNNGISNDDCPCVANFNQKWEYPVYFEYLENDKILIADNAGFRIKGNCSRKDPMKSMGIYWRKEYGKSKLEYPMYSNISVTTFKRLFLRNSGDFRETHIRDGAITQIYKDYANVDYQEYKPCVLYLNDEYWGIYNIREMITPHHFENHYGVDKDNVDLLEGSELNPIADDGSVDGYLSTVVNYLQNNDLSEDEHYNEFLNIIDVDSYIDNIIVNTYIGKVDWPSQNTKWWRDRTSANSKWRWVIFDSDWAFKDVEDVGEVWMGELYGTPTDENRKDGFFIFNHLIKNKHFTEEFFQRYMFFIEVVFEKERVERIIRETQNTITPEYDNHRQKWNTLDNDKWAESIDGLVEYNNLRNDVMMDLIKTLQNETE